MDNRGEMLQLCRLCLVKDDVKIPIFEEQGDIRQIFLKISSCLPVKVTREDKLPKKICDGCSYKLDMLYEFWNTTANAEKQLLSWLGEAGMNAKMTDDTMSAVAQQIKPTETFVKQEAIDPSDIHTEENDDDKSYMFQQKFTIEEGAGPSATVTSNESKEEEEEEVQEPPPKRARRTAAVKAQIAMDPESDDDDDSGEPLTKVEDESEESDGDDHDPPFVDVPSTSADDQPGPSGVGKDGVEAPLRVIRKKVADGLMCYLCLLKYPTAEDLKNHVHTLPEILYCTHCDGYFDTTHGCSKSKILCAFCKKPLKGVNFNKHKCFHMYTKDDLEKLKDSKYYYCELCDSRISKREIVSHRRICEIGIKVPEKRSAKCKICDIVFKNYNEYRRHRTKEHNAPRMRTYNCKPCEIKFETRSAYRRHRYQVHDEKYQICFMCGKTVMNLNQHVKSVHGNPNEVKCSRCDKTFSCKKHLNRHMLVHSNEFKHKCTDCGKGFKTPFSLKVHKRSHDAVKPFECGVCLKTFTTKQWRDNHLKTHY